MRIWPVDRLVAATERSEGYRAVLRAFPTAIDPITLFRISFGELRRER